MAAWLYPAEGRLPAAPRHGSRSVPADPRRAPALAGGSHHRTPGLEAVLAAVGGVRLPAALVPSGAVADRRRGTCHVARGGQRHQLRGAGCGRGLQPAGRTTAGGAGDAPRPPGGAAAAGVAEADHAGGGEPGAGAGAGARVGMPTALLVSHARAAAAANAGTTGPI